MVDNPFESRTGSGWVTSPNPPETLEKVDTKSETPAELPEPEEPVVVEKVLTKEEIKQAAYEKAVLILKENGGLESNVPINSEYWSLMNTFRSL